MNTSHVIYTVMLFILIVGGFNWGLVGLFNFNLVTALFGQNSTSSRVVYTLVGLAAVYVVIATLIFHNANMLL